ncbi:MAG: AAA family ATPase [Myxococcales bacterium]|nr:AAA family ATPase [Myxococcales bacterium]
MLELVILTGLQAAGKSTFCRERLAATHEVVSKDAWPNARNRERRQRQLIAAALAAGRSVVVDNTNPSPVERGPLIELGRAHGARVVSYWFPLAVAEALVRNAGGGARVPDLGVLSVAKRLVAPGAAEGFDQRFEVRIADAGFVVRAVA